MNRISPDNEMPPVGFWRATFGSAFLSIVDGLAAGAGEESHFSSFSNR